MNIDTNNIKEKVENALLILNKEKDNKRFEIVTICKPFSHSKQEYMIKIEVSKKIKNESD